MREFIIGPNDAGQRLDKYLFKLLKNAGSGLIFKQLRNKNIVLNNKKSKGNTSVTLGLNFLLIRPSVQLIAIT